MKKIIVLIISLMTTLFYPCYAYSKMHHNGHIEDSLNYKMIENQIKDLESDFLSSNHLKSGSVITNQIDSTHLYLYNNSSDSVLEERTLYDYDLAGRVTTELLYKWNPIIKKILDFKYLNYYDKTDKITSKQFTGWYIRSLQGSGNYNGFWYYNDTTVALPYKTFYPYKYTKLGQPAEIWRFTFDIDNTPMGTLYKCYYDSVGNKTSVEINNGQHPSYVEEYTYDSNNTLLTITQSSFYQYNYIALWFCYSKIKFEYAYDSSNRVANIQSYYYSYKADEWRNVSKADYTYQDNGMMNSRLYSILDTLHNELMPVDRTDYKYNKNNKIQLREDYALNKLTSQWEIRKKRFYYYNSPDLKNMLFESILTDDIPFSIFPNPTEGMLWIENSGNFSSTIHIYNDKGQCVKTDAIEKGMNTFNLFSLPGGMYIITIPMKNDLKSYKLIVE